MQMVNVEELGPGMSGGSRKEPNSMGLLFVVVVYRAPQHSSF